MRSENLLDAEGIAKSKQAIFAIELYLNEITIANTLNTC